MDETTRQSFKGKRAGVACLNCRLRKVRCDVQVHGIPCRNCKLDDTQCRIRRLKNRGRPARIGIGGDLPTKEPSQSKPSQEGSLPNDVLPPRRSRSAIHTTQWLPPNASDDSSSVRRGEGAIQIVPSHDQIPITNALDEEHLHQELSYTTLIDRNTLRPVQSLTETLSPSTTLSSHDQKPSSGYGYAESDALPSFIKPFRKTLDSTDLEYLQNKGALQIPAPSLRNEIISCYLQFIHPQLPVLDASTLRQIAQGSLSPDKAPMSILLFQAAMFSAVNFIDIKSMKEAGYDTPLEMRRAFYARARLLYDLDVEPDRISIIQSLVLMAYMSETPGDARGGWHWIGVAVTLAMTLGLHRRADYVTLAPEKGRLQRRIWWSCYIRDRTLALAVNRPWRIRDDEFDTPMLTLADFGISESKRHHPETVEALPVITDREEDVKLALISIGLAQLCTQIGEILNIHFSILPEESAPPPSRSQDGTGHTSTLFFARSKGMQVDRVMACDQNLQAWFQNRPSACIYSSVGSNSCVLQGAFLNLLFFSMVSALHCPLFRSNMLVDFVEFRMWSERRAQNAAMETSRMSHDLHKLGLGRFYPGAGAFFQVPAVSILLRELHSPNSRRPNEIFSSILPCINIVEDVKERHVGAEIAMTLVVDLLRRSNIVLHIDNYTKRVIGMRQRNSMRASDPPRQNDEAHEAAGEDPTLQKSPVDDGRVTETNAGNSLEQSIFATNSAYPSQEGTRVGNVLQSPDLEMHFPPGEGDPGNQVFGFVDWDLLQFADNLWVQSPQLDMPEVV